MELKLGRLRYEAIVLPATPRPHMHKNVKRILRWSSVRCLESLSHDVWIIDAVLQCSILVLAQTSLEMTRETMYV